MAIDPNQGLVRKGAGTLLVIALGTLATLYHGHTFKVVLWVIVAVLVLALAVDVGRTYRRRRQLESRTPEERFIARAPELQPPPAEPPRYGVVNRPGGVASTPGARYGPGLDVAVDNQGEFHAEDAEFGASDVEDDGEESRP